MLHLLRDGGGVRISERNRLSSYELVLDVSTVVWCMESLQAVLVIDKAFFLEVQGVQLCSVS